MDIYFVKLKNLIFKGANNSEKTTVMDSLIAFQKIINQDYTITFLKEHNNVVKRGAFLPSLDLQLNVEKSELNYFSYIG